MWAQWLRRMTPKQKDRLLEVLAERYADELHDAALVEAAAEGLPYEHLRKVLRRIAARERKHAEWLRAKIRERGGTPPPPPRLPAAPTWREVLEAFESEKADQVRYLEEAYGADDPELRELLTRIQHEEEENYRDLLDVVTRMESHAGGA
ncbi:Rubrerythrin [Oceanithermus profundus DSM 14977]|uniref:Rubrerythrin n=2 Tax=Oceanithermus profundus TaxID=187137 RepID=E4U5U5_OCEP5|nr:Rubrerythrin [Oceanithermus profundus DSM 14977]